MIYFIATCILAANAAPIDAEVDDAVEVYRCDFEEATDANYDDWPDGWTRRRGKGYPSFVLIGIADDEGAAEENRILKMVLDGGAATAYSQPIPVSSQFNYVLSGNLKTSGLKHHAAFLSLTLYDADRKPIGRTYYTPGINDAHQWREVRLDIATPDSKQVSQAVIGVHLRPHTGADLQGSACVDNLTLSRLPRMTLDGDKPHNVYFKPGEVQIDCRVSGVLSNTTTVQWQLFDVYGRQLAHLDQTADGEPIEVTAPAGDKSLPPAFVSRTSWRIPIEDFGFYRITASLAGERDTMLRRSATVAVLRPLPHTAEGEFGWSLPAGEQSIDLENLPEFLAEMGIHWLKFPLWKSASDESWFERFAKFYDRLSAEGIQLIALVDQPPADVRANFGGEGRLPIASVFLQTDQWPAAIETLVQRQSLKIRWWQLGIDDDASFIGLPDLPRQMANIKSEMERYGQRIRLGFNWRWMNEMPNAEHPPWAFISQSMSPVLTADELGEYLAHVNEKKGRTQVWLSLWPLPEDAYPLDVRVRDLVERMIAAKIGGAERIFVPDPFDEQRGLLHADATPRKLMVVWRTAATLLSGTEYVGSIRMRQGSHNHIFARGEEAIMVVWNEKPTREVLYLGEDVLQIDPWGRAKKPEADEHRQVIEAGPLPCFITGVNEPVARWRMKFHFNNDRLRSVFARPQNTAYTFTNTFDKTINGTVAVVGPKVWDIAPKAVNVRLTTGVSHTKKLRVQLGADSNSGEHPVRIDFDVSSNRRYRFSVYRTMHVGLDDIQIDVTTRLRPDGSLLVEQQITNNTEEEVSFNCMLFAPNRRRQRRQIIGLARGKSSRSFVLPDGEELLGKKLWLRAEEIGGERILNFNVEAHH